MTDESQYLDLLSRVVHRGNYRKPLNEFSRYEVFGEKLTFDLRNWTLPLLTTKKVLFKSLAVELLWFISGAQDISLLKRNGVKIWDSWCNKDGIVGPLYGYQWRHWRVDASVSETLHDGASEIDQFKLVLESLRDRPEARSHVITAWRPDHLDAMAIKPCHVFLQFYRFNNEVSLMLTQRSCDLFLGVPFNLGQFALLTHMVAQQLNCVARELIWSGGDVHVYENHVPQAQIQLKRKPKPFPKIELNDSVESLFDYKYEDFLLKNYNHGDFIPAEISLQGKPGKGFAL